MHARFLPYFLTLFLALSSAVSFAQSPNEGPATFQLFYDSLSPQGTWTQTDAYGYVFQPTISDPAWAPYTDGRWVYSDAGWTWMSDEPWGWATYHYGRWANLNGYGWVWVPGYRWAPAWVSWRLGDGYVGWAPLPPATIAGADYVEAGGNPNRHFHFGGDVDVSYGIGAGCYNFIHVGDFGEPNCRPFIVNRYNNYVIVNRTTNITNITVYRQLRSGLDRFHEVTVFGPPRNEVDFRSRRHVPAVKLTETWNLGKSTVTGSALSVYAPQINQQANLQTRPVHVVQTVYQPTLNRGTLVSHPLMVNPQLIPPTPPPAIVREVEDAQAKTPRHARVAPIEMPDKIEPVPTQKPLPTSGTAPPPPHQ
jgi:hypothetical protein